MPGCGRVVSELFGCRETGTGAVALTPTIMFVCPVAVAGFNHCLVSTGGSSVDLRMAWPRVLRSLVDVYWFPVLAVPLENA